MTFIVDVKKKKGERFESMLRRFNTRVIQSGKLIQARKIRFHARPKSHLKQQEQALRKIEIREKREWLRKIGELVEETRTHRR